MLDWVEKYRPKTLKDIIGNRNSARQMAEWAKNWDFGREPLLLYGKPGIGKTSAAYALANDMKWEIIELNASDQRTKSIIEKIAGSCATTMSLTGAERKLLLFDEADNLHGSADKGGARAILDIIKISRQPIILIANDSYGIAKELKSACEQVQFRALTAKTIAAHLRDICSLENLKCSESTLNEIAEGSAGDMRSALNKLYAAGVGEESLTDEAVSTASKDERASIFDLVGSVLKSREDRRLLQLSAEISETPDVMSQWIEEGASYIKNEKKRAEAYHYLSESDIYIGRTFSRQYYTLWRYASALMLIGTAYAAEGEGISARIMPPSRWRKMAGARKQKGIRNSVFNSLSERYHMPSDTLRDDYVNLISVLIEKNPVGFARETGFDRDELDFFLHDRTKSADIIKQIKKEEKEREKAEKASKKREAPKRESTKKQPEIPEGKDQVTLKAAFQNNSSDENKACSKGINDDETTKKEPDCENGSLDKKRVTQATLFDGF
ncbi:replication factor C large subunit [Methanoplanus endosymbiosus]|uniref:Replication factor C large subunit n=1 Tax=Methanoplanus endosymbiosus TaxID=33865 RepID=A0A9E7PKG5_9EURY|nr:replication factor C large subunit [Methanoplanus endosymbiosus]UUX91763.1 replication factor C large subunit [Methanoplanus endosymbiosus]